jgi:signal transduction histidine kinase
VSARSLGARELERLLDVGRALVSELDLETLLVQVLEVARELTGARFAALGVLDERKEELERFLYLGIDAATRRAIGSLPRGRGVLGELIRSPRPLRLSDVGDHPRSYGFPPGHPTMCSFLGVPILIRGEAWGNLYLTEKEGGDFDELDERSAVILADWAAIAIANARLYQDVERRREELEHAVRGLEATTQIARALGGETELDSVLTLIVKRGRALVEARWALIMIAEGDDLVVRAFAGELSAGVEGRRLASSGSLPGEVLGSMRAERISELERRPRTAGLAGLGLDAETALSVPLVFRGRAVGVLLAADRTAGGPDFTEEDERLAVAFAASAATAVATAQSVEAERLRDSIESAEQERRRWARELHDDTLQDLGALEVVLETGLQSGDPERLRSAARVAVEQVEVTIKNLQSLITELRPAALDELGVRPAVEALVERTRALTGIDVGLEAWLGPTRQAPQVESTIYRIVQEAVNNAVKHASASRVEVRIVENTADIDVEVRDDGIGFEPGPGFGAGRRGGFGLVGMRERVSLVGGALEIESRPGEGTTVRARIPSERGARGS